jgi:hypothetical protein
MLASTKLLACCAVFIALSVIVEAEIDSSKFAVPFEINERNGESKFGDKRLANVDDEEEMVEFEKAFPFGNKAFKKFYVYPNGIVQTVGGNAYLHMTDKWKGIKPFSVPVLLRDVVLKDTGCKDQNQGCGVYWRKGDSETTKAIAEVLKSADLRLEANQYPNSTFEADPDRTLVVTWYRVLAYKQANGPSNTFQGVLTTDGTKSYAIFSYVDINYPNFNKDYDRSFKAGVVFENEYPTVKRCQVPVDVPTGSAEESPAGRFICQTNSYGRDGVFVIGLTDDL